MTSNFTGTMSAAQGNDVGPLSPTDPIRVIRIRSDRRSAIIDGLLSALAKTGVVLVSLFFVAPVLIVLITSFNSTNISFPPQEWSLDAYFNISDLAIRAFLTSLALGFLCVFISALISIPAGLALARGRIPGRSAIETVLRSPLQLPPIVLGLALMQYFILWRDVLSLNLMGSFAGLLFSHVLIVTPYMLAAIIARVSSIRPQLEEAAAGLGARSWLIMFRISVPLLRPGVIAGMFLGFVMSFEDVAVSIFLVGANTNTFPVYLFGSAQVSNEPALYAVATLGTVIAVLIALVVERFVGLRTVLSKSQF
ncbi:MAG TPA: ABC transporter permease [Vicinamibacterales bacterium]